MGEVTSDDRAVSEGAGVAVLVFMSVAVTAAVGASVLVVMEDQSASGVDAEISFTHVDSRLIVSHQGGEQLQADRLYLDGTDNNVTWAQNDGVAPGTMVGSGDLTQLGEMSPYGNSIGPGDVVEVVYITDSGNRTVVNEWEY